MQVQFGKNSDIDKWMELVEEIKWNFPGLETQKDIDEYRMTVLRFMSKGQALYVKHDTYIVGILLFSKKHNMICCLGVSPQYRRCGITTLLLATALEHLDPTKTLSYQHSAKKMKRVLLQELYTKRMLSFHTKSCDHPL